MKTAKFYMNLLIGLAIALPVNSFAADLSLSGEGTETNPYKIASLNDLGVLSNYMATNEATLQDVFLALTADIDLTGVTFSPLSEFDGTFDGQKHTISGISYTTTAQKQGVFTTIGEKGCVKNLTLKGDITSANAYTGGFVGTLSGKLEDCVNELNITSSSLYTAGFAAVAADGAVLSGCINNGTITSSSSYTAGIVANSGRGVTYTNCGNKGEIHNTGTMDYTAGITAISLPSSFSGCYNIGEIIIDKNTNTTGVAGILAYADNTANATSKLFSFTDCYNTEYLNASGKVAGILGEITLSTKASISIEMTRCYNTGDIIASGSPSGNIGTAGISCFYAPGSKFIDCYNTGTIKTEKKPYCGGIIGHFKAIVSATIDSTLIKGCWNSGDIIVTPGQGAGIIAYSHKNVTITGCWNTGAVSGKSTLGGITSTMASGSQIINCWNGGDITTDSESAGGIVPNNANQCVISGCVNTGNITSNASTKAGGIAANTGSEVTDCVNFGTVTGVNQVGGLSGNTVKDKTSFTRCYNAGKVAATGENALYGGIIGLLTSGTTSYWTDNNSATDTYYASDFGSDYTITGVGKAANMATLTKLNLGDNWTTVADNCLPIPTFYAENQAVIVNSAAIILAEGNTLDKVTSDFTLGTPQGVEWTSSSNNVTISGNTAKVATVETPENVTLTATLGKYKREWAITITSKTSGIASQLSDNATVVSRTYYNAAGQVIQSEVAPTTHGIYIVKELLDNGTTATRKLRF